MARILFIQPDWMDSLGIEYLSSSLRKNGHESYLVISASRREIDQVMEWFRPDLVAFSCVTGSHKAVLGIVQHLKTQSDILTIVGGPHPTFYPNLIENRGIDIICRGEGEHAIVEIADAIDGHDGFEGVSNIWYRKDGKIAKNAVQNLVEDIDAIPLSGSRLVFRYGFYKRIPYKRFISSRGCPFACTFCHNYSLRKLYSGKGKYVRRHSVERVIEDIERTKVYAPIRLVTMEDEVFALDKHWLSAFSALYRVRIGKPLSVNVHVRTIDEAKMKLLGEMGCTIIRFGIESGSDRIRKDILNKRIEREQIIETAKLARRHNIQCVAFNILGCPTETIEEALETVFLNREAKIHLPWASICTLYPGTGIAKMFLQDDASQGSYFDGIGPTYFRDHRHRSSEEMTINMVHKLFLPMVKMPAFHPLYMWIIKRNLVWLARIIFLASSAYRIRRMHGLSLSNLLLFGIREMTLFRRR